MPIKQTNKKLQIHKPLNALPNAMEAGLSTVRVDTEKWLGVPEIVV
jgi:hypothetical protein